MHIKGVSDVPRGAGGKILLGRLSGERNGERRWVLVGGNYGLL